MFGILRDFESAVGRTVGLSPIVLVGPGLVCVIVGLFIWLGGLGFRKVLAAAAGAATGAICGFCVPGQNIMYAAFIALLAGTFAMLFERIYIVILAAALAAAFGFVILAGPHFDDSRQGGGASSGQASAQDSALGVRKSTEKLREYMYNAGGKIKHAGSQMPMYKWAIIAVLVIVCVAAGASLRRLTSALCCSVLGTVLIFGGMILLLLNKNSRPVSIISNRPLSYLAVFAAMIAFGTIEQLLLCRQQTEASPAAKGKKHPKKEKGGKAKESWRGR
jgi:hypothetical protein